MRFSLCFIILHLSLAGMLCGQSNDTTDVKYRVRLVLLEGNKRTRDFIIYREISIQQGDLLTIPETLDQLEKDKNKIFNTLLFVTVDYKVIEYDNKQIDIIFLLKERWYTFPIPILELADRNFNEWWVERGHDLRRVDFGMRFVQENFSGRNDALKIVAQGGFTKKFELFYRLPYIDQNQKHGLGGGVSYSTNKNVAAQTLNNKLDYIGDFDNTLRERFYSSIAYTYRRRYYNFIRTELTYNINSVADTIRIVNSNYLGSNQTRQEFLSFYISFTFDFRDAAPYPLKGSYFQTRFDNYGFGISDNINMNSLFAEYSRYITLSTKYFLSWSLKGKISDPIVQPYMQQRGLGYSQNVVRGYEYYVVDGQHYGMMRATLKRNMLKKTFNLGDVMLIEQFRTVPFAMYLKTYFDAGYVADNTFNSENLRLSNKLIYGGGIGLDLVTYYDIVWRLEMSINSQGESNFFLHFVADI